MKKARTKKKTSFVWTHVKEVAEPDGTITIRCKLCAWFCTQKSSTSSIAYHLTSIHSDKLQQLENKKEDIRSLLQTPRLDHKKQREMNRLPVSLPLIIYLWPQLRSLASKS